MGRKAVTAPKGKADEYKSPISPTEPKTPPPPAGGPGSPVEIIFSFDTTGSMSSVLTEVRKNLSELIDRLQNDIPSIRIGVIAHGDYCDEHSTYVIKMVDFTRDTKKLVDFVNHVVPTGGGDGDECYELALKTARTQFTWSPGTLRSLVVIGDADPHQKNYHFYKDHTPIDWKEETDKLFAMGVHIYGVYCGGGTSCTFYKDLAKKTDGTFLELKDFKNIFDMICAICYKEHGAEYFYAYEQEVREREKRMTAELDHMLVTLRKSASNASTMSLKTSDPPTPRTTSLKRVADTKPTPAKRVKFASVKPSKKITKPKKKGIKTLAPKTKTLTTKASRKTSAKSTKTSSKKSVTSTKTSSKTAPKRTPRELKPAGSTITSCSWSKWELMFSPKPEDKATRRRRNGHVGYCNPQVFVKDTATPAVYEVAVTPAGSTKKYVVFIRGTVGVRSGLNYSLFRYSKPLQAQVDDLLKQKCRIFLRRCLLSNKGSRAQIVQRVREGVRFLKRQFDYSWCKKGFARRTCRSVTKDGVMISNVKY